MFQRLTLVGNLGRDPELKFSNSGIPIANFPVATNHKWTDPEGKLQEETVWFRIAVYGKQAEACSEFLSKGQKVLVEGVLLADEKSGGPRIYERKDGTPGASFEVRATTVRFLSAKGEGVKAKAAAPHTAEEPEPVNEELPF
jgi:single-strand DNA-binding protein